MADTERDREKGGKIWDLPHKLGGIFMVFASRRDPQLLGQVLSKLQDDLATAGFYHEDRTSGYRRYEQVYLKGFDVMLFEDRNGILLKVSDTERLLLLQKGDLGETTKFRRYSGTSFMTGEPYECDEELTDKEREALLRELLSEEVDEDVTAEMFRRSIGIPSYWRELGLMETGWIKDKAHIHLLAA